MLTLAVLLVASVIALEWYSKLDYSLGVFYVFPMIAAGAVLTRTQILVAACALAFVRGQFLPASTLVEAYLHFTMATLAYGGVGLLIVEMTQRRHRLMEAYERLRIEKAMRYRAEHSLRVLAESSPAGIVTLNAAGELLSVNRAALDMLGVSSAEELTGASLQEQVPVLASVLQTPTERPMRASATSWARRANGQLFPITVWFSTYGDGQGRCLAGILVDTSEEVRDREREGFRHFHDYNRLLAGAVAHEIRNMCSAISVVLTNLRLRAGLANDVDFHALTNLVEGLGRIASFELRAGAAVAVNMVDLRQVFDQLRVVIEPDWTDLNGQLVWSLGDEAYNVPADAHALLQVFLNLAQNSLRAVQGLPSPYLEIQARHEADAVVVSVIDSGTGVRDTSVLFQPFRPDADGTGLGLYISRAVVRMYGGDLQFVPVAQGCRFDVVLPRGAAVSAVA